MMQSGHRIAQIPFINRNANPSIEASTSGYSSISSSIIKSGSESYVGSYGMQTMTNNSTTNEGWKRNVTGESEAGKEYTFSVYFYGPPGKTVILRFYDDVIGNQDSEVITIASTWTRYSLTKTFGIGSTVRELQVVTNVKQDMNFFSDAIQHELGATASAYTENNISEAVEIGPYDRISFILPSLNSGNITFKVAEEEDGTYVDLKKVDGSAVTITAGSGNKAIRDIEELRGHRYMKIISAAAQTGERNIEVMFKWPK